ncbi:MAG: hypothetical protein WD669_04185 [Pirellulales bacterium]
MKRVFYRALTVFLLSIIAGALAAQPAASQDPYLVLVGTRKLESFDAEFHIGLVAEDSDPEIAAENTEKLNDALDAMWPAGVFTFAHGAPGPVLLPISFAAKEFYFAGELKTATRNGGALIGGGGFGYPLGSGEFGASFPLNTGGAITRFTRIDSDESAGGALLRLRGAGFRIDRIQFNGQPLPGNIHSGTGELNQYGILLEGRDSPPTGKHVIGQIGITGCSKAIAFLAGYDDEGGFVSTETHADQSHWQDVFVHGCRTAVWSNNQQAVWHHFGKLVVGATANVEPETILDVERGGLWKIDMLAVGPFPTTVLRVKDFSPNASRFDIHIFRDGAPGIAIDSIVNDLGEPIEVTCHEPHGLSNGNQAAIERVSAAANGTRTVTVLSSTVLRLDGTSGTGTGSYNGGGLLKRKQRLTLFEFAGNDPQPWKDWDVRFSGSIATEDDAIAMDQGDIAILNSAPGALPTEKMWFDINNLEHANLPNGYKWEVVGAWRRLVPE